MEERDEFLDNEEILDAVARFEEMLRQQTSSYFDVSELEGIIDYYIESSDLSSALKASNFADRLHPSSLNIRLKKAVILMDKGKYTEARSMLESLESFGSFDDEIKLAYVRLYLYQDNFEQARKIARESVAEVDESKIDFIMELASLFYNFLLFNDAEFLIRLAWELDQEDVEILLKLSEQVIRNGNIQGSVELYNSYLDKNPFSELIWFNLGNSYSVLDEFEKSIEAYDFALAIQPGFAAALVSKGNSYFQMEKFEDAKKCYEDYLATGEDNGQAYFQIGLTYERLEEIDLAIDQFKKAIDHQDYFAEPFFMLSSIAYNQENYEEALNYVIQALNIDDNNTEYLFLKGKIYTKREEYLSASEAFKKAKEEDPTDTESWFNLAYTLNELGQSEDAIVELNKAIEFNPDDSDLLYHLSASWFKIGNDNNAVKHLKKAFDLSPELLVDLFEYYPDLKNHSQIIEFLEQNEKQ